MGKGTSWYEHIAEWESVGYGKGKDAGVLIGVAGTIAAGGLLWLVAKLLEGNAPKQTIKKRTIPEMIDDLDDEELNFASDED